jgi:hypothetical protein
LNELIDSIGSQCKNEINLTKKLCLNIMVEQRSKINSNISTNLNKNIIYTNINSELTKITTGLNSKLPFYHKCNVNAQPLNK